MTEPASESPPATHADQKGKREPRWQPTTTKFILSLAILFAVASQALQLAYVAPTVKANAETARALAQATAIEKQQNACYDRFTARVTGGNLASFAADLGELGAIATLVIDLSTPAPQRDPNIIPADIAAIKVAAQHGGEALAAYNQADDARTKYSAAGRPLPCPLTD